MRCTICSTTIAPRWTLPGLVSMTCPEVSGFRNSQFESSFVACIGLWLRHLQNFDGMLQKGPQETEQ